MTEVHVLMVLGTMGPLAIGQIAKQTRMGSAVVTGIVDRLETKGFAKRVNHTLDRRMRVVVLEGPRADALVEMSALADQVARDLSERDMAMLVESIEEWIGLLAHCTEELDRLRPLGQRPRRTR